jgi:hypothetical protein
MANNTKVTFTLDHATIDCLQDAALRLGIPKSEVVREAVQDYHARLGKLSEVERRRMLANFDQLVPLIPGRSELEVKRELEEIRKARRRGGRKSRERQRP